MDMHNHLNLPKESIASSNFIFSGKILYRDKFILKCIIY